MIDKQTTITGDVAPNIRTEEVQTGTKKTQNTAGEKLKETLDTMIYTNPLLQATKPEDFTQQNFPRYQKDMENILRELLGQMSFLKLVRRAENIMYDSRLENIAESKRLCKFLEEYCHITANQDIPLGYKYL